VAADAQSEAREMFQTVDGTRTGHYRTTGLPVKLPSMPSQPRMGAPLPGEHSEFVLQEALGMDAETVRELAGRGIVQQHRG
jgi:crotonobetainyl-CoA:carnitine CoA-transferase CaiB-like acyl-CoA transferase